jgi:hypothetical protein
MPMPISDLDEYDKVVKVSWFTPDKPREELMYVIYLFLHTQCVNVVIDSHAYYRSLRCILSVASTSETF